MEAKVSGVKAALGTPPRSLVASAPSAAVPSTALPASRGEDVNATRPPSKQTSAIDLSSLPAKFRGVDPHGASKSYLPVSSLSMPANVPLKQGRVIGGSIEVNLEVMPADPNMPSHVLPGLANGVQDGKKLLAPAVASWKAAANPERVAAFDRVREALDKDPRAQFAFDSLLVAGRLTDSRLSAEGKPLLETLDSASSLPTRSPLRMEGILADVVQELADPVSIGQELRGTCTAASMQTVMAISDPAEYARIMTGLAAEPGKVTLRGGQELQREPGSERPDDSRRTDTSRLFQDAAVQLQVSVPGLDYRNPERVEPTDTLTLLHQPDGKTVVALEADPEFMRPPGVARVLSALTGTPHESLLTGVDFREIANPIDLVGRRAISGDTEARRLLDAFESAPTKEAALKMRPALDAFVDRHGTKADPAVLDRMDRVLERGQPVSVGIPTDKGNHQITLVGLERGSDGAPTYLASNSWKMSHRFTRDDLSKILLNVALPAAAN